MDSVQSIKGAYELFLDAYISSKVHPSEVKQKQVLSAQKVLLEKVEIVLATTSLDELGKALYGTKEKQIRSFFKDCRAALL